MDYTLPELFESFRSRPAMFTGEHTLSAIQIFLEGYSFGAMSSPKKSGEDPFLIPRVFHDWVTYRLQLEQTTKGWCMNIQENSVNDEEAIERFLCLLDEYRSRRRRVVAKLEHYQRTYVRQSADEFFEGSEGTAIQFPQTLSLVTYTEDQGFFVESESDADFPWSGLYLEIQDFERTFRVKRSDLTLLVPDWNFGVRNVSDVPTQEQMPQ